LAEKGGVIICQDKPEKSPGLTNYPKCDEDVRRAVARLWGNCNGTTILQNKVGRGRLVWMNNIYTEREGPENKYFRDLRNNQKGSLRNPPLTNYWSDGFLKLINEITVPDVEVLKAGGKAMAWGGFEESVRGTRNGEDAIAWIHRKAGNNDVYFVSSQVADINQSEMLFRVTGKVPELWDPETGKYYKPENWSQEGNRTKVAITFNPMGAVFVVFKPASEANADLLFYNPKQKITSEILVGNTWQVSFPAGYGAPATAEVSLGSLTSSAVPGIKYFSGTASYRTSLSVTAQQLKSKLLLDLGAVKNLAEVIVNDKSAGVLWKPPFQTDITSLLKPGRNLITVKVTNTWWNRMVGDEQLPEDLKWNQKNPDQKDYGIKEIPEWVWNGGQRPSKERVTFTTWKYVEKSSALEPSGLIGPVKILLTGK
jgi:hypothetical protein